MRFLKDKIYTYISEILVAVNPFKVFPEVYNEEAKARYKGTNWSKLEVMLQLGAPRPAARAALASVVARRCVARICGARVVHRPVGGVCCGLPQPDPPPRGRRRIPSCARHFAPRGPLHVSALSPRLAPLRSPTPTDNNRQQ